MARQEGLVLKIAAGVVLGHLGLGGLSIIGNAIVYFLNSLPESEPTEQTYETPATTPSLETEPLPKPEQSEPPKETEPSPELEPYNSPSPRQDNPFAPLIPPVIPGQ